MISKTFLWAAVLTCLACPILRASERELVWADEFNYQGLPDPSKWSYEQGYLRNHEAQFYTRARPENARVENGLLILEARKDFFPIPVGTPNSQGRKVADYTSASLNTLGKFSFLYGRLEMCAKLPHGKGTWPAFWTLGENIAKVGWPLCGEMDVMELVGKEPDEIHATAHWKGGGGHEASGKQTHVEKTDADFHVYAMDWSPERIDFFVDDRLYQSVPVEKAGMGADNPFRKPQYLLLNFAVGGDWGGEIDDRVLPQQYLIDYVRVYREKQ